MAQSILSRLSYVGLAKETTQGVYVPPTAILPVMNIDTEDMFAELRDESLRNNDSVLQGMYQGPGDGDFGYEMSAYPDLIGHSLRAMIGPDTITPGVATTSSGATIVGATTISTTVTIPAASVISIDSGAALLEYATVASVSGVGPFVLTLAKPLTIAHTSGVAVASQTKHVFAQTNTRQPSYSLVDFNQFETRAYPGCVLSELGIKIDPKAIVTLTHKWMGYPSAMQTNPTPTFTKTQPLLGWQWTMTNAGAASTRGLSLDWAVKREVESIHASTGTQNPEEVFPGALTLDGTYKARFSDNLDLNLFLQYLQQPVTSLLTQPVTATLMGATLAITTSQGGFYKGKTSRAGKYAEADFSLAGISNATDGGTMTATLTNFTTTAY
jgi:hypothetical protein